MPFEAYDGEVAVLVRDDVLDRPHDGILCEEIAREGRMLERARSGASAVSGGENEAVSDARAGANATSGRSQSNKAQTIQLALTDESAADHRGSFAGIPKPARGSSGSALHDRAS